jgi:DNA-binding transcriptional MerR regulator
MADREPEEISWSTEYCLLNLDELANAAGIHPKLVEQLIDFGLVVPVTAEGAHRMFPISAVERLRRIARLRRDVGVNLAGVAVILDMRERMENLQKELRRLRRRFGLDE